MQLDPALTRRIDDYLRAVEKHLAGKPTAARQEVIAGLRDHINESLRRNGQPPTLDEVDTIIAAMDPPECFAETEPATAFAPPPTATRGSSNRWFLLALAFLALNTYGVWRWTSPPRAPQTIPVIAETVTTAPESPTTNTTATLSLVSLEQADVSASRQVTLRLTFNSRPDPERLPRFLNLATSQGESIGYRLLPANASNTVLLVTDPVMDERLHVSLNAGLPSTAGLLPTASDYRGTVQLGIEFMFRRLEANSPSFENPALIATFNAFPEPEGIERFVEIEPPVTRTIEAGHDWRGGDVTIRGNFKPGHVYTVTFKEGMPAANGERLKSSITRTVQFPNREPALQIDNPGRYLSPQGSLAVPVSSINIPGWTARLHPVLPQNLVDFARRDGDWYYSFGNSVEDLTGDPIVFTNTITSAPNEKHTEHLRLRDLSREPLRGAYWLDVEHAHQMRASRLIVITDLGIATRVHPGGLLVWINALSTATPVSGAHITVYARNNERIANGISDERGLVQLELPPNRDAFVITAEKDGDLSFVNLNQNPVEHGDQLSGPPFLPADGIEAAVFTERGVYRPGEKVFVQALARNRDMNAPAPFPALFRVIRPDGRTFRDTPVMLDAFGSATAEIVLPEFLPTGRYAVHLVMPGTFTSLGVAEVALEDFVPPQIRVAAESTTPRAPVGEDSAFTVRAAHLFGSAANGLKVTGFASIKAAPFAPTSYKNWTFGDPEKAFATIFRNLGSDLLDEDGAASFSVPTSDAWRPPAALEIVHQGVVLEAGGRSVTAYGSSIIDPYPFYIGLCPSWEGTARVGETQQVSIIQLTPAAEPVAEGKPLTLELARVQWNSVLRQNANGRFEWRSERQLITTREDTIAADGAERTWTFSVPSAGEYMLLARDPASGASTRITFNAASPDQEWVDWSREKPGRVELALDRERYRPGDVARLLVKAPFSGQALLTIESSAVRETRLVTLEQNTAEIEIPVQTGYYPNVYCVLTLIRPARAESVWRAHRAIGAIALPVTPPDRHLAVAIEAPERIRPQTTLATRIRVIDEQGQPARGLVTVMAVDEGICMLTAYNTPDPNQTFLNRRQLAVDAYDLYSELMPLVEERIEETSAAGGDADSGLRRRLNPIKANRFKPVALWQQPVALDENGVAEIQLNVPEFTGELRLMAVAINDRQAGSAARAVQVKRDLVAQPSLPRFLAIGDTAEASITLFNESDAPVNVRVLVTCGGPLRADTPDQSITLAAGASTNLALPLVAGPGPGKAHCRIEVEAGAESYAETIELPVRPAAGTDVRASSHVLAPGDTLTLTAPPEFLPATVSFAGGISAVSAMQYARALDYVVSYPYGCLEQTASGAFPLLHAAALLKELPPGAVAFAEPRDFITAAISRILSMQQPDGGFSLWPYARETDVNASLYAIHFLVEAGAAGYTVPDEQRQSALAWLRQRLDRTTITDAASAAWRDDMSERAYMCHILALAKKPDAGWNARLREISDRLAFADQVHVAAALMLSGEPRQAVALLNGLGLPVERARTPGRLFDSSVRDAALLMSAWLDIDPANPAIVQLGHYLQSQQHEGHWGNTQDNAMALLALGKYSARQPARPQIFTGTLRLPGADAKSITHKDTTTWQLEPGAGGDITIRNSGPGVMVVWSRIEGVPARPANEVDEGVRIRRTFFDLQQRESSPGDFVRGDMVIVRLTIDTLNRALDQLVIEDLLPAGWEIENPHLATSQQFGWVTEEKDASRHRDARDDRMLIFTGAIQGERHFYYAARAITPGQFTLPPVTVSGMYEPEIRSISGGASLQINP